MDGDHHRHYDCYSHSVSGGHSSHRSRHDHERERDGDRDRDSRSGSTTHRHRHQHRHHHQPSTRPAEKEGEIALPHGARKLTKTDVTAFEPLFAHYLDLQKGIDITNLDETEARGRWKSFMGKWNRGELAAGWYEAEIFERAVQEWGATASLRRRGDGERSDVPPEQEEGRDSDGKGNSVEGERGVVEEEEEDDDDDDYGPSLPGQQPLERSRRKGPGIPTMQDLVLRRELHAEERQQQVSDLRAARKADRKLQKEQLEELVPRAEPGTRERKLEKRQAVNEKMRSFRDKSPGGDEVAETDLVGGGDELAEYKRALETEKQKVSERQLRREEFARARAAERDERIRAYREREEGTIEKLKELARLRFG